MTLDTLTRLAMTGAIWTTEDFRAEMEIEEFRKIWKDRLQIKIEDLNIIELDRP